MYFVPANCHVLFSWYWAMALLDILWTWGPPACVCLASTVLSQEHRVKFSQDRASNQRILFSPAYLGNCRGASPSVDTCNCTAWRSILGGTSISTAQRFKWLTRLWGVWNCFPQMGHSGTSGLLEDDICASSISSRHLWDNGTALRLSMLRFKPY